MSGSPTCDTENKTEKLSEANLKLRHALRAGGVNTTCFGVRFVIMRDVRNSLEIDTN